MQRSLGGVGGAREWPARSSLFASTVTDPTRRSDMGGGGDSLLSPRQVIAGGGPGGSAHQLPSARNGTYRGPVTGSLRERAEGVVRCPPPVQLPGPGSPACVGRERKGRGAQLPPRVRLPPPPTVKRLHFPFHAQYTWL